MRQCADQTRIWHWEDNRTPSRWGQTDPVRRQPFQEPTTNRIIASNWGALTLLVTLALEAPTLANDRQQGRPSWVLETSHPRPCPFPFKVLTGVL